MKFLEQLISHARNGDRRALARLLSSIENGEITLDFEAEDSEEWNILALTGPPGVGKSCLLDRLLHVWTNDGMKVGVLAVDPSSPRSGGALLGDRVRMTVVDHPEKKDLVYVRSVATRKSSGSVPSVVQDMAACLLMTGWDRVIIETVGAGQSEVRCAAVADRIVLIEGPARGDGVQAEKAGLLELADAILVNKSDLPGAERHANELRESLQLGKGSPPEVRLVSALREDGIDEAAELLMGLKQTSRAERARWRERILAHHERQILNHKQFTHILTNLEEGLIGFDEAYAKLREEDE